MTQTLLQEATIGDAQQITLSPSSKLNMQSGTSD